MLIDGLLPFLSELSLDQEGRVQLGAHFLEHAGLASPGEAVFVGRRNSFQIWAPQAWDARAAEALVKPAAWLRGGRGSCTRRIATATHPAMKMPRRRSISPSRVHTCGRR